MNTELIKIAISQGVWAVLSVVLILYILKAQEKRDLKQEEREKNYQDIISKLTEKFNIIEDVKKDVEDIKDYITNKEKNNSFISGLQFKVYSCLYLVNYLVATDD